MSISLYKACCNFLQILKYAAVVDIKSLKQKYPDFSSDIDELVENDPSTSKKYILWQVKQLNNGAELGNLISSIVYFHNHINKFERKDINSYKNLEELNKAIADKSSIKTRKEIKLSGADKIYSDSDLNVYFIKTKEAAQKYGAGTKWCITMSNESHFESYTTAGTFFYFIINNKLDQSDDLYKIAVSIQKYDDFTQTNVWSASDKNISEDTIPIVYRVIIEDHVKKQPKNLLSKIKDREATAEEEKKAVDSFKNDIEKETKTGLYMKSFFENYLNNKDSVNYFNSYIKDVENKNEDIIDKLENGSADPKDYIDYPSPYVRNVVVKKLDPSYLKHFINDTDDKIRFYVAKRIDEEYLLKMINDEDNLIRLEVARRLSPEHLPMMINDQKGSVLKEVISRIDPEYYPQIIEKSGLFEKTNMSDELTKHIINKLDENFILKIIKDEKQRNFKYYLAIFGDFKYLYYLINDKDDRIVENVILRFDSNTINQLSDQQLVSFYNNIKYPGTRENLIRRIGNDKLHLFINDPNAPIRAFIAHRLPNDKLYLMKNDNDHYVKTVVLERMFDAGLIENYTSPL